MRYIYIYIYIYIQPFGVVCTLECGFQVLSRPRRGICKMGKLFGEHKWNPVRASTDGLKYICIDKLYADIKANRCLVYSFGLADDWSFEESMVALGCTVGKICN